MMTYIKVHLFLYFTISQSQKEHHPGTRTAAPPLHHEVRWSNAPLHLRDGQSSLFQEEAHRSGQMP